MKLRPLTAEDVSGLTLALGSLSLLVRYNRTGERLSRDLNQALDRGESLWVAEIEGRPRALAWFVPEGTMGMAGYLRLLAVAPEAQRHGVGRALLATYETETARASRHATLMVSDFNHHAQRFYERAGYHQVGRLPALVLPGVDEILYWKRLGAPPA